MSPWARRATALSLGAFALSIVALSSAAEPATTPNTSTPAATTTADAGGSTDTAAAVGTATAATAATTAPAATSSKPTQVASKPAPTVPLEKQTFTVVEAVGVKIALKSGMDVHKSVSLKKGQMLVLKSQNGTMIEVDGPYSGKPIDHYTNLSDNATMGYDAKSFNPKGHCSGSGSPHPSGGPNPDETGGAELQATHCQ
jgi:hypothetical protein